MAEIDPYADGLSIVLELSRPATDDDIEVVRRLLDNWLAPYEGEDFQHYRNCGAECEVGSRCAVVWADRIDDPSGGAAARDAATRIGALAEQLLPLTSWRIADAAEASDADLIARVGAPVFTVRPGGDLVAQVEAAGVFTIERRAMPRRLVVAILVALIVVVVVALRLLWN